MAYNKIHVNSSTGLSLNDRFTAMAERTTEVRRRTRSRSRSLVREQPPLDPMNTQANRRLLLQLERRHKMLAAMKVKRKSLRPTNAGYLKRGSIKAMRVAANGRPIKANSLTKVATMKADLIGSAGRRAGGRPLRRSNSTANISQRLGVNRVIGGAAERVERRRLARLRTEISRNAASFNGPRRNGTGNGIDRRGRSRSRTRFPAQNNSQSAGISAALSRGRSRSRSRNRPQNNGRSQSRNRAPIRNTTNVRRGRSMSRNRDNRGELPIKARLGVRPSANGRSNSVANRQRRDSSGNRRNQKVLRGRVDKRAIGRGQRFNGNGGRVAPARGRSRSRTRKGLQQTQQQGRQRSTQQQRQGRISANNRQGVMRRGRSRQRGSNNNNNNNSNNNNNRRGNGRQNGQQQQQTRRGRSRSRRGGRNLGQNTKPSNVKKEDLDKELDTYMATTRNENDVDFLLKN